MKANYTIAEAKSRLIKSGLKFEGKKITGRQPGIRVWGAVDFLQSRGYTFHAEMPKKVKDKMLSSMRGKI